MKNRNIFHNFGLKDQIIKIYTCCDRSDGFSHNELKAVSSAQITQNIIRETIEVEKMRWIKIKL